MDLKTKILSKMAFLAMTKAMPHDGSLNAQLERIKCEWQIMILEWVLTELEKDGI